MGPHGDIDGPRTGTAPASATGSPAATTGRSTSSACSPTRAFATAGCGVWIPADSLGPTVPDGQDLPQGMFRAGIDVQPGVYSTSGNAICTWTRLRNARHEPGSAIAAGSVNGAFGFVTIQAGDMFFENRGCGPSRRVN